MALRVAAGMDGHGPEGIAMISRRSARDEGKAWAVKYAGQAVHPRALKRLKDPELGVVARRMTQDPDENVRELARELLEEDGRR